MALPPFRQEPTIFLHRHLLLSSQQSEGVPPGIFQEPCCNSERSKSGVLERRGYGPMGRCLPVEPGLVWVQTGFGYQNYFFSRSYKVVIHTS